jgi:hypothetical protein
MHNFFFEQQGSIHGLVHLAKDCIDESSLDPRFPKEKNRPQKLCKRMISCHKARDPLPWNELQNRSSNQISVPRETDWLGHPIAA